MGAQGTTGVTEFVETGACELLVTRSFAAPPELLFAAYTDPRLIPRWMTGPDGWSMPICELDLRVGGHWHFVWRQSAGSEMAMRGTYREVAPPGRLVSTESWGAPWPDSVNTLVLTSDAETTHLSLTITFASAEARGAATATGMRAGMGQSYARLDALLALVLRERNGA